MSQDETQSVPERSVERMVRRQPSDVELTIHALHFTANHTETGCGVTSAEERKAMKMSLREICDRDKAYVARLRDIANRLRDMPPNESSSATRGGDR